MNYPITFGKYLLLERINVGGMAEVFKAKAFGVEGFERILAIKRILPNMADDDEFINMFVDEARIAVQLSHANIVQIYELGKFEGQYYIAMEYVSGKDLRQILDYYRKKKELLPLPAAAFLASKICDGLDYAHRKSDPTGRPLNVIHRDVSPQNILVSWEGAVKITDFGIAKAEDRASKTQAGVLKGKFGYMSPEQVRGLEIDHRSDIFALGILMYEMMTGKRLFLGESDFSTLEKVRNAEVPPPTEHNPEIPPELEQVLIKALSKERDERYQWASELHDDLQQFLIEANTIYNAKRLAGLLQVEYADAIEKEMQKMEEFVHMVAPAGAEALAAAEDMKMAASRTDPTGGGDDHAEKTMIFESGFSEAGATQVQEDGKGWPASPAPSSEARTGSVVHPGRPSIQPRPSVGGPAAHGGLQQKHVGAILIAAAAFVSLLILLIVLLTGPSGDVGTIVVTSSPTDAVEVFLDGALIGNKTPITKSDVLVGEHILLARSARYSDRAYRFELVAGNPAVINIELEPTQPIAPRADGVLLVTSNPPGASVNIAGAPMGVTPKTLTNMDSSRPVILEITLDGYETITQTYNFPSGEKQGKVAVELRKGTTTSHAPVANGQGRIVVRSRPSGATVYLGRQKKGVTPLEISGVDVGKAHTVEINKTGYRPQKVPVAFRGDTLVPVDVVLEAAASRDPPRKDRPVVRNPKPPKKGGGGGGGGRCSGDGGKISVMPIGQADCKVTVGKGSLGVAPFFKKPSPVGKCEVRVTCPNGKKYRTVKQINAGADVKVIIKPGDWR